jgi:integrase
VTETSYDIRFWKIEGGNAKRPSYRVVWLVAGQRFTESFGKKPLADSFRSQLITAASKGEAFDVETGLPLSQLRTRTDVSFLAHAREYTAFAWNDVSAKSRISIIETLSRVVPVVTQELPGAPDAGQLRRALRKHLNPGEHAGVLDEAEAQALAWLEKASRPVSVLKDESVISDVLDALAINLDGTRSAPDYFSRRRRVLHRVLGYAVRKKRLGANPVSQSNLPESWIAPEPPAAAVDPRCVGTPAMIAAMLVACSYVGRMQGPRFVAFFGCMYYAMMRPSEVAALTGDGCHLPATGWGYLIFADSSPAAGKAFTDDGQVHEHRGLKGRNKGRPSIDPRARRPTRRVPIPPELVALLREHIARFGTGRGGRLFRSEQGNPIQPSTWWHVWQKVRALSLTPAQVGTPLLQRPYDLRHSGVTWRLSSGVHPPEVAAWAGHSVEVLMRVYARCMTGLEDVWITRIYQALHLEDRAQPGSYALFVMNTDVTQDRDVSIG